MRPELTVALTCSSAALAMMVAELALSRRNERKLRSHGAIEPGGDVYRELAFAYPIMFVVMAVEGVLFGPSSGPRLTAGFAVFVAAKLLKLWAIATLGARWSYRILVLPNAPLVTTGPYAHLRHPNYLAVFGEIAGFALMVDAPWTGAASLLLFGVLVRRRIAVEERALGLARRGSETKSSESRIPHAE